MLEIVQFLSIGTLLSVWYTCNTHQKQPCTYMHNFVPGMVNDDLVNAE